MPVTSLLLSARRPNQFLLPFMAPGDELPPGVRRRPPLARGSAPVAKRPPRPKLFGRRPAGEDACAVVRGILIAALDRAYCLGELGEVLWRDASSADLVKTGLDALAAIQLALFPEVFAADGGNAANCAAILAGSEPDSLVPPAGPKRAGADRLAAFAAVLRARA